MITSHASRDDGRVPDTKLAVMETSTETADYIVTKDSLCRRSLELWRWLISLGASRCCKLQQPLCTRVLAVLVPLGDDCDELALDCSVYPREL